MSKYQICGLVKMGMTTSRIQYREQAELDPKGAKLMRHHSERVANPEDRRRLQLTGISGAHSDAG